jgi:hypothetical protein
MLIAFGIAASLAMLLPIIAIRAARVEPRMLYPPSACLILAGCAAMTPLARSRLARSPALRIPAAVGAVTVLFTFGVGLIGDQALLRQRSRMDWAEAHALKSLVPVPYPETLFLAARVSATAAGTGQGAFDRAEFGAWTRDAYGCSLLRQVYGREGLYSKRLPAGDEVVVTPEGVTAAVWMRVGYTRRIVETRFFPWERVIVFAIEPDGTVSILPAETLTASPHPSVSSSPPLSRRSGLP